MYICMGRFHVWRHTSTEIVYACVQCNNFNQFKLYVLPIKSELAKASAEDYIFFCVDTKVY